MKNILMSLLVITVGSVAFAQEAKVIKVKGQQAIVTFPSGVKPQVGQTIDLGGGGVSGEAAGVGTGSRANSLSLQGQFSILNNSGGATSTTTTTLSFTGRYGWNMETMEFGPIGTITYVSQSGYSARTLKAGGFFDFNFVPNKSGVVMVWGVGGDAQFGQETSQTGSNPESSTTVMDFFVGANVKYFGLADNVAVRADAGLEYDRNTPSSGTTTTEMGLMTRVGLSFYF